MLCIHAGYIIGTITMTGVSKGTKGQFRKDSVMKVMVTGGTGFVGSHTVAELVRAGHDVKLLVRDPSRVRKALEPLGVGEVESVIGDVTDKESVERALDDCDAVIHCASVYSLDPRAADVIKKTNVAGTDLVIGAAHKRGLDPIVHVSSIVALIGAKGAVLTPNSSPHHATRSVLQVQS